MNWPWVCSECRHENHIECKGTVAGHRCICDCLGLPAEQAQMDRWANKVVLLPAAVLILAIIAKVLLR